MKPGNAIEVKDVRKKFKVYLDKGSQLKERLLFRNRNRYEERWVLNGVSFDIKQGEAVGLIGHNGCGKSTTLKLLTRIMYPDSGTIEMKGRVSSLIELGAGFHPDMSGRENIYTNASIFGLSKKEIDERIDDIIEFSEMEPFLDNPVRTYSSGMYMRLAFSVAINVNADILLIDEILAVGDVNFQAKCFNKLREIKAQGTTIVIVSHSMGQIEQICDRCIWSHDGQIKGEGIPRDIDKDYLDFMGQKRQEMVEEAERKEAEKQELEQEEITVEEAEAKEEEKEAKRWGNGRARFREIYMSGTKRDKQSVFETEERVCIHMKYKLKQKVEDAVFGIGIFRDDGIQCYGTNTRIEQFERFDLTSDGEVIVNLERLALLPGRYTLDVAIESDMATPVDYYKAAYTFEVYSSVTDVGVFRIEHNWEV